MKATKIFERIKKLLAMSTDASSPEEAAIAAKRARSMMDKHQVTELDLSGMGTEDEQFGEDRFYTKQRRPHSSIGVMAVAVAKLNDCNVSYSFDFGQKSILFKGFAEDIVVSVDMLTYLIKQCIHLANLNETGRKDRNAYKVGFASGVAKKMREIVAERGEIVTSGGQQLVVVKKALVEEQFGQVKYKSARHSMSGSVAAYSSGRTAGYNTSINKQITA